MNKEELEKFYESPDPWNYQNEPADENRKHKILGLLEQYQTFSRALDLCCGEGWLTQDLPAREIHGYEISDNAASRFPKNVQRVLTPVGKYDLVVCTGALYSEYDWQSILTMMRKYSSSVILTCHIAKREEPKAIEEIKEFATQIDGLFFPYNRPEHGFIQRLRVFRV